MIKKRGLRLAACLIAAASLFLTGFQSAEQYAAGERYIKAATYTSDEWAINFWSLELHNIDEELRQIREDGFNNIVLVVPWRWFQPSATSGSVNEEAYEKLEMIMEHAAAQELGVILRLGYQWDYYTDRNVLTRYYDIFHKTETRAAWLDYGKRIYETVSKHENFTGAFITWEDFWSFLTQYGSGIATKQDAMDAGFAYYATANYSLRELSVLYGEDIGWVGDIYYPTSQQPARKVLYEFFDAFLNQLLADTQQVFPGISLEVRLDVDPIPDGNGGYEQISHSGTFGSGSAAYSSSMLAASMGFSAGTQIHAEEAVRASGDILKNLVEQGGKPTFVDQFLYVDNTPEFSSNASLISAEVGAYIRGMASNLRNYSCGYAVWTYRDYADNVVENPQFGEGLKGWKTEGNAAVVQMDGNQMLYLTAGASAQQTSMYRSFLSAKPTQVQAYVSPIGRAVLSITAGDRTENFVVDTEGLLRWENIGNTSPGNLQITCVEGEIYIDDVKYYSHITEGGIYEMDGSAGAYREDVLALNRLLQ